MQRYEWILENFDANDCDKGSCFESNKFDINGFGFILEFYPKGLEDAETERWRKPLLFIELESLNKSVDISSITIVFCLKLTETNTEFWWVYTVDGHESDWSMGPWDIDSVAFEDIQGLNSLTLGCYIHIVNVFDTKGFCVVYDDNKRRCVHVGKNNEQM